MIVMKLKIVIVVILGKSITSKEIHVTNIPTCNNEIVEFVCIFYKVTYYIYGYTKLHLTFIQKHLIRYHDEL